MHAVDATLGKPPVGPAADPVADALVAVARGDRAAFAELYRLTAPLLLGVALKLLRRRDLAEDVLQEALLTVWQRAERFVPERGAPLGWLSMVVRNRAIDRLRREMRQPAATASATEGE